MKNASFDTDLTDAQWQILQRIQPAAKRRGRPRTPLRAVVNAILYVAKSGCVWRLLPSSFPPWPTVYHHFRQWSRAHTWSNLNDRLRARVRATVAKRCRPTAAVLDSQTVRSDPHGGPVGYDMAKKTKGRKRFILVDTLGLLLGATVVAASTPERAGAQALLTPLLPVFTWLRCLWVDGGFSGPDFAAWVRARRRKLQVEVVKRPTGASGFEALPRPWLVERSFAWLVQHRRLVRVYERTETRATAWIFVAMIRVILRPLDSSAFTLFQTGS